MARCISRVNINGYPPASGLLGALTQTAQSAYPPFKVIHKLYIFRVLYSFFFHSLLFKGYILC